MNKQKEKRREKGERELLSIILHIQPNQNLFFFGDLPWAHRFSISISRLLAVIFWESSL